ncbi:MAG: DNA polymerase domain-containing protein [Candidatus Methanomethylicaceae archaeon]
MISKGNSISKGSTPRIANGWILDAYPSRPGEINVWIIAENGARLKLTDEYFYRLYVYGASQDLDGFAKYIDRKEIEELGYVDKCADFMDAQKRSVLELCVKDYRRVPLLAREILRRGDYERLSVYNVDIPVEQAYMYDRDIYPLAHVLAYDSSSYSHSSSYSNSDSNVGSNPSLIYKVLESVDDCEYEVPQLRSVWLSVETKREGAIPRFSDEIDRISVESDGIVLTIEGGSEEDKITHLVKLIEEEDPDIIFTRGGDSFTLPYLAHRAFANGISEKLVLGRENVPLIFRGGTGRSLFSYGKVYYRAPARRLYGRIHVDVNNSFIYREAGLEGLIEVSRTCRVPLQRAARASIGTIMSSLQLYTAWREGILIPWKKREPESFKTGWELLVADRGGLIYEPRVGLHTDVVEVDFMSMFPTIMLIHNISAETVLCRCCPESNKRVPELGYNICERRVGIVPKTLELVLKKRLKYKDILKETKDPRLKRVYEMRQSALKWILVTCFGYLGYRNAKFGKIDAHIAVCAFARDALMRVARLAEERGFEVVHGIVDSLWIKKPGVTNEEVEDFCREASRLVGVRLKAEGRYRWIVFLPSKVHPRSPVMNRYYGVFEDGSIKVRGIEARRSDMPDFVKKAQMDMIRALAPAVDYNSFIERVPEALATLRGYVKKLEQGEVDSESLLIKKCISKHHNEYVHNVLQALAVKQLAMAGIKVLPGETVQYLIRNYGSPIPQNRVRAAQLLEPKPKIDSEKYLEMLFAAGETLLSPFGYDAERIRVEVMGCEYNLKNSSGALKINKYICGKF